MKKLPVSKESWYRLPAVKLYRDDIDTIVDELSAREFRLIQISDDEYSFDSLAEFEERRGKRIYNAGLKWKRAKGHGDVEITIRRWGVSGTNLFMYGEVPDDLRALLVSIFRSRRRWYGQLLEPNFWFGVWLLTNLITITFWREMTLAISASLYAAAILVWLASMFF